MSQNFYKRSKQDDYSDFKKRRSILMLNNTITRGFSVLPNISPDKTIKNNTDDKYSSESSEHSELQEKFMRK